MPIKNNKNNQYIIEIRQKENLKNINRMILLDRKRKIVKDFLDLIILHFVSIAPRSGYDIIVHISVKYKIIMSSGVIYGFLYKLERNRMLIGYWNGRKRIYTLSQEGQNYMQKQQKLLDSMIQFVINFFKDLKHEI